MSKKKTGTKPAVKKAASKPKVKKATSTARQQSAPTKKPVAKRKPTANSVLKEQMAQFEKQTAAGTPMKVSKWIRANKALLVAGGAVSAAAGKVIAWLVTHSSEVEQAVEVVGRHLPQPAYGKVLNLDSVTIHGEPLAQALNNDPILIRAVAQEMVNSRGYVGVHSDSIDRAILRDIP